MTLAKTLHLLSSKLEGLFSPSKRWEHDARAKDPDVLLSSINGYVSSTCHKLFWSACSRQTDGMLVFLRVCFLSHCLCSLYSLCTCFISGFLMKEAAVFMLPSGYHPEATWEWPFVLALLLIRPVSIKSGSVNLFVFSCLSIYSSSFFSSCFCPAHTHSKQSRF